ncbi:MAG: hypothetical protein R2754_05775 [Microthrixaceae bacterium]
MSSLREWFSLEDDAGTWLFDVTFLASRWECIWGAGCAGIEPDRDVASGLGCCTHGAHFADDDDRGRVGRAARRLEPAAWQHRPADGRRSPFQRTEDGWQTRVVDGACIFLNRTDRPTPGCALHAAAVGAGERPIDWKPEVCWQLPLRLEHHTDESGAGVHTLREWRRRDWGEGGEEFGWWCTEEPEAYSASAPVYRTLADEIEALVGAERYRTVTEHLDAVLGVATDTTGGGSGTAGEVSVELDRAARRRS